MEVKFDLSHIISFTSHTILDDKKSSKKIPVTYQSLPKQKYQLTPQKISPRIRQRYLMRIQEERARSKEYREQSQDLNAIYLLQN